jgi:hypothetical protein
MKDRFRYFRYLLLSTASALICASVLTSCSTAPRYDLKLSPLHKDSVLLAVFLDTPAAASTYQEIASQEMTHLITNWTSNAIPLYEVRFEFISKQSPQTKYASIIAQVENDLIEAVQAGSHDLSNYTRHWKIYLY